MPHEEISEQMGEELIPVEVIYVALGTDFEKDAQMLLWALKHFPGHTVVIIHVHCPSKRIEMLGGKFSVNLISEQQARKHRKEEKEKKKQLLYRYVEICTKRKVPVRAVMTIEDDILRGIQALVNKNGIKRLVMGSRFMWRKEELLSCCKIWLVCNGQHISTSDEPILNNDEAQAVQEEDLVRQLSGLELDPDEHQQFITPPSEWEDEIVEARTMIQEVSENPITHQRAAYDDNVLLLELEMLRRELEIAEEKVHLSLATLQKQIFDQEIEIQELRKPRYSTEFTLADIQRATNNFHASHKIGKGGYGLVYRGILRETPVAIKMLDPSGNQGHLEYQQEVLVLSRMRHPNIVQLIGICSESSSLVYEYLENGSVQERLSRKNSSPPLSWQLRIRIIAEQRSALIFLHSNRPCIVHADVKCDNILLDANYVSRLGDFGTARMIHQEISEENTICRNTSPMGTIGYMDPTFIITGQLTPQSDVYSFGLVILRLLTGLPVQKIGEQVEDALRMGALQQVLDASAGDWPIVQTEQLLRLALRCSHRDRSRRPDLVSDEWKTLETLRTMAGHA